MGHSGAILPPTSTKYQIMEEQCNVAAEHFQTLREVWQHVAAQCSMRALIFPLMLIQQQFQFISGKVANIQMLQNYPHITICLFCQLVWDLPTVEVVFLTRTCSLFLQFEIQKLRIYCDPEQNNRETACEIPGVVSTRVCLAPHLFFSPKATEDNFFSPTSHLVQSHLFLL